MRGIAWRIFVGSLLAVALCLVTRSARAMPAPYCDDRAATSMAPPPTMLASETAMRRAPAAPSWICDDHGGAATTIAPELAPGQGQHQAPSPQADPVLPACAAALAEPAGEPLALPAHAAPTTDGVHCRIDRPPRS